LKEFEKTFESAPFNSHLGNFNPFNKQVKLSSIQAKQEDIDRQRNTSTADLKKGKRS